MTLTQVGFITPTTLSATIDVAVRAKEILSLSWILTGAPPPAGVSATLPVTSSAEMKLPSSE